MYLFTHTRNVSVPTPNSRATSAIGRDDSRTRRTACSRNSGLNFLRVISNPFHYSRYPTNRVHGPESIPQLNHHKRDSIEAHLTIVFAALAVARWLETSTGVSIKQLVKTLRRYRTIDIQAGDQTVTAEDPLPDNVTQLLDRIHQRR